MKFSLLPLSLLAFIATPALAQVKSFQGGLVTGLQPNTVVEYQYPVGIDATSAGRRALRAGPCGELVYDPISGSPFVYSTSGNLIGAVPANAPTRLLPRCIDGQFEEARTQPFKLADGRSVMVGLTPGQFYEIRTNPVRRVRANACGFAFPRPTTNYTEAPSAYRIQGATQWETLNLFSIAPPLCRTVNSIPTTFWPAPSDYDFTGGAGSGGGGGDPGGGGPDPT